MILNCTSPFSANQGAKVKDARGEEVLDAAREEMIAGSVATGVDNSVARHAIVVVADDAL